ncbi:hypothetical protein [Sphingomonas sp. SUN039]|uniref:hypothetical protein n=1 Tax=Sphingomonas sp. SUN039 TaxID=2937787 RepID=UPI0021644448|nr:hypothetical protein [Sphingomonas sp. SUN039]UVO54542.1 hypothetical protein M0209_10575 [Sphingomonas sp. SUN039]
MFGAEADDRAFLADQLLVDDLEGRWVSRFAEPEPATISLSELSAMPVRIHQYMGELEIVYSSPVEFIWHYWFRIPQCKLLIERTLSLIYSRKLLLRSDQIDVLQTFIDQFTGQEGGKTVMELMEDTYGLRWAMHPRGMAMYRYNKLLLDSLRDSGELTSENGRYIATPKAVSKVIQYELEDRRHRDSVAEQKRMAWLTIVLAIIGAVQVYQGWNKP